MKVGFKRGHNFYSTVIRTVLNSQWAHGGVLINGQFYESTALKGGHDKSGVRDYPMTDAIAAEYVWFDIGGDDEAALRRYEEVKNYGYDFFSLLSFLPVFNVRDSSRMYCWELVLWMIGGYTKWRVTPEIILTHIFKTKP